MKILIVFGSDQGHTRKIAARIDQILTEAGNNVDTIDGRSIPHDLSLSCYDAVVIGASVHAFKFRSCIVEFVRSQRLQLKRMPTAFFSVSLWAACSDPHQHVRLSDVVKGFFDKTGWHPDSVANFAGAIPRTFGGTWFMRRIAWRSLTGDGVATDTAAYEYTDWEAVQRFADEFAVLARSTLVSQELVAPTAQHLGSGS